MTKATIQFLLLKSAYSTLGTPMSQNNIGRPSPTSSFKVPTAPSRGQLEAGAASIASNRRAEELKGLNIQTNGAGGKMISSKYGSGSSTQLTPEQHANRPEGMINGVRASQAVTDVYAKNPNLMRSDDKHIPEGVDRSKLPGSMPAPAQQFYGAQQQQPAATAAPQSPPQAAQPQPPQQSQPPAAPQMTPAQYEAQMQQQTLKPTTAADYQKWREQANSMMLPAGGTQQVGQTPDLQQLSGVFANLLNDQPAYAPQSPAFNAMPFPGYGPHGFGGAQFGSVLPSQSYPWQHSFQQAQYSPWQLQSSAYGS